MPAILLPLLLAAAATSLATAPSRAPVDTLAPDAESHWVPFDLTAGNQIRFTMTLGGRRVTAILDTGVSMSVLSRAYATANDLRVTEEGRADVIGGTLTVGKTPITTLTLGGLTRRGGALLIADLPAAATGGGHDGAAAVDLLVGRDLTAPYALDIDYQARRFRLLKSGRMPFAAPSAPLSIAPDRQLYVTTAALAGRPLRPMVVDTGDGAAVTVAAPAWAAAGGPPGATTTISYGLAGPVVSDVAIVPVLTIGQVAARDVEVRIEGAGGFSETIGTAGRIGSGFLQRYRVLLDPGAGHMLLRAESAARTPDRSTSGLLLGLAGNRLKVLHVMRGGPAAAAGWREGDMICAVDGIAVTPGYIGTPMARWPTGTPGRAVQLAMCDGTKRTLTLRRFY